MREVRSSTLGKRMPAEILLEQIHEQPKDPVVEAEKHPTMALTVHLPEADGERGAHLGTILLFNHA